MGISGEKIDKEQLIEDLHFLSDQGNYKSIKYAIECIDKLEKIERIVARPTGFSEEEKAYNYMMQVIDIKEVLEKG